MNRPAFAVQGAGILPKSLEDPEVGKQYHRALQEALNKGFDILVNGSSAMEAVIHAACTLEDCELFNAGKGSVFTAKGEHEMDGAVMDGRDLQAGAVTGIHGVNNPIRLAKNVLNETDFAPHRPNQSNNLKLTPPQIQTDTVKALQQLLQKVLEADNSHEVVN